VRFLSGGFPFCGFQQIGPCDAACGDPCCDGCCETCCDILCCEAQEVCELIYMSQNDCYARGRRAALHRLSNRYDCDQFPDVMTALIYGLNDCDETVRRMAADEIGDQLREHPCCCTDWVVSALSASLCDCDWRVQRESAQALRVCGYTVTNDPCCYEVCCSDWTCDCCDMCCDSCCDMFCDSGNNWIEAPADDFVEDEDAPMNEYNPAPMETDPYVPPAPAPTNHAAPEVEQAAPSTYFPPTASRSATPVRSRNWVQPTSWVQ
jgi:hypothetical protein